MKTKTLIFIVGFISLCILSGCTQMETDVQLTRRIFNGLCQGNQSVQNLIDWEKLKAMGVDVGKTYTGLVYEKERRDYKRMFFFNLAYTFKASGGKTSAFTNWRVKGQDINNTIIAVDTVSGKVLLLTLAHKVNKRKLSAIEWEQ